MRRSILFILLIIYISPSDCRNRSIIIKEPSLCVDNTYTIPLFDTQSIRMTFNQTRLRQLNIHTIRIRALIQDRKVAEFENNRHVIKKPLHLSNNNEGNLF
jgi:hypothetical protein